MFFKTKPAKKILLAIFLTFYALASAQWKQANGPLGGRVNCFASNGNTIYAGTEGGVYSTQDGGKTWQPLNRGMEHTYVFAIALHGSKIFAGTLGDGVYMSPDNGSSWTDITKGQLLYYEENVRSLLVRDTMIIAATDGGIITAPVSGGTWTRMNGGLFNTYMSSLVTIGSTLLAVGTFSPMMFSDKEKKWYKRSTVMSFYSMYVSGDTLYAAGNGGVYYSTDTGKYWIKLLDGIGNKHFQTVIVDGMDIYAGNYGAGAFHSPDLGNNWAPVNSGLGNMDVQAIFVKGNILLAGTYGGGIFISSDKGNSWKASNKGLVAQTVNAILTKGSLMFAATEGDGIFKSVNNGLDWTSSNTGITGLTAWSLASDGNNLFAGTDSGVFLSVNDGSTWTRVNNGLVNLKVHALAIQGGTIYAGTEFGLHSSSDSGKSWSVKIYSYISSILVKGNEVYIGTMVGFYRSVNGTDWTLLINGLTNRQIMSLAASGTVLYAGTAIGGVYLSADTGKNWKPVNKGLLNKDILSLATHGTDVFAGTNYDGGVFLMSDTSKGWILVDSSLYYRHVKTFMVRGDDIFAGTRYGGVWWSAVKDLKTGLIVPVRVQNISFVYPNPSSGIFTIREPDKVESLKIYNMQGVLIYAAGNFNPAESSEINISFVRPGIYFALIQREGGILTEKIEIK